MPRPILRAILVIIPAIVVALVGFSVLPDVLVTQLGGSSFSISKEIGLGLPILISLFCAAMHIRHCRNKYYFKVSVLSLIAAVLVVLFSL